MFIGSYAGDDDEVSMDEFKNAVDDMENMSGEEIMAAAMSAHMYDYDY